MKFIQTRFIAPTRHLAGIGIAVASFGLTGTTFGFTRSNSTLITDGSFADVSAAVGNADAGDTVSIPVGRFTWGDNGSRLFITKPITLAGAGPAGTTIQISATGSTSTSGLINISAAATVRDFSVTGASANVSLFSAGAANGWRISNITYTPVVGFGGYFCYVNGTYGLIDACNITGASSSNELIFGRGPTNSWQTPSSTGGADNVFIEDCTFNGPGYVCDANSNARFVVRFCTINGPMKIDAHGLASNTPARGVREMEVYGNRWTAAAGFWTAIELRGGSGIVFDNVCDNAGGSNIKYPSIKLNEYGCLNLWSNFNKTYQTPHDYPITDQIGVGPDPKSPASAPYYFWHNTRAGADWDIQSSAIPSGAIAEYETETGDSTATFTMADVIKSDRDYFKQTLGTTFDGSTGVGVGIKAQMLAITGKKVGVGFWVTDERDWNEKNPGPDGQLYVWNGLAWQLTYTPYTYPHPLRGTAVPYNAPLNNRVRIQPPRTK